MSSVEEKYGDILHLPHHVSAEHPPLSMWSRAAQFSPFAALSGYEEAVQETARLTERRTALEEADLQELDRTLRSLLDRIDERPELTATYFLPDARKEGGSYEKKTGRLRRLDPAERRLCFTDGSSLALDDIIALSPGNGENETSL